MAFRVLSCHYVLTNSKGEVLDSSRGGDAFPVLEGAQQIIPGLEVELFKMNVGEKKKIFVVAAQAYGPVNEQLVVTVARDQLPEGDIQVGMQFGSGQGQDPTFTVTKIEGTQVSLDGNHPLAGQDLTFDVEIMEIREATEEEKAHGHAHGPHGHHH